MSLNIQLNKGIIDVKYHYTDEVNETISWLNNIKSTTAFDFETASKYNSEVQKKAIHSNFESIQNYKEAFITGLSHPSETILTHLGFSNSDDVGYVIILLNDKVRDVVLDFLVTTDVLQVWHNAIFDFRHIFYHRHKFPRHYIDTRLLVKTKRNNVNPFIGTTSLKPLMKTHYGEWEKERVDFTVENAYDEKLIKYTAIDVCATYKLYMLQI